MSDEISIIAGGWSVKLIDLDRVPGTIIGVNDSSILTRCDMIVSMDRLWTEGRFAKLRAMSKPAYLRRSAVQNVERKWPWLHIFDCDNESTELSEDRSVLNGPHSGFCAFNLAYQLRPSRIYLFGFDMNLGPKGEDYWYPRYSWQNKKASSGKYVVRLKQFESAARKCKAAGIEVINASPFSAIQTFKRTSEFLRTKEPACVP